MRVITLQTKMHTTRTATALTATIKTAIALTAPIVLTAQTRTVQTKTALTALIVLIKTAQIKILINYRRICSVLNTKKVSLGASFLLVILRRCSYTKRKIDEYNIIILD